MSKDCGDKCCGLSRYNGPDLDCAGISKGTPYDEVVSALGQALCDIEFEDGQSIDHVSFTSTTGTAPLQPGETDTYTVWGDASETINLGTFDVYNGADGADGLGVASVSLVQQSSENIDPLCTDYTVTLSFWRDVAETDLISTTDFSYTVCDGEKGLVNVENTCVSPPSQLESDTDVWMLFDVTSGAYNNWNNGDVDAAQNVQNLAQAATQWYDNYKTNNPGYTGNLYIAGTSRENYVDYLRKIRDYTEHGDLVIPTNVNARFVDSDGLETSAPTDWGQTSWTPPTSVLLVAFINESAIDYHRSSFPLGFDDDTGTTQDETQPTATYITDHTNFKNELTSMTYFGGVLYPVNEGGSNDLNSLLHQWGVLYDEDVTLVGLEDALGSNYTDYTTEWSAVPTGPGSNPYAGTIYHLAQDNWIGYLDKQVVGGLISFTPLEFETDLNTFVFDTNITTDCGATSLIKNWDPATGELLLKGINSCGLTITETEAGCIQIEGGSLVEGSNITITGTGTPEDPYVISSPDSTVDTNTWDMRSVAFVDPVDGDDATAVIGDGNKPFQTINAAHASAFSIFLKPGTYTEVVNVQSGRTYYAYPGVIFGSNSKIRDNGAIVSARFLGYARFTNGSDGFELTAASTLDAEIDTMESTAYIFMIYGGGTGTLKARAIDTDNDGGGGYACTVRGDGASLIINTEVYTGFHWVVDVRDTNNRFVLNCPDVTIFNGGLSTGDIAKSLANIDSNANGGNYVEFNFMGGTYRNETASQSSFSGVQENALLRLANAVDGLNGGETVKFKNGFVDVTNIFGLNLAYINLFGNIELSNIRMRTPSRPLRLLRLSNNSVNLWVNVQLNNCVFEGGLSSLLGHGIIMRSTECQFRATDGAEIELFEFNNGNPASPGEYYFINCNMELVPGGGNTFVGTLTNGTFEFLNTYSSEYLASVDITLTGTTGTADITIASTAYTATFNTDLTTTANDFVTTHAATILTNHSIVVTAASGVLTFAYQKPVNGLTIVNTSGDLNGTVGTNTEATEGTWEGFKTIEQLTLPKLIIK